MGRKCASAISKPYRSLSKRWPCFASSSWSYRRNWPQILTNITDSSTIFFSPFFLFFWMVSMEFLVPCCFAHSRPMAQTNKQTDNTQKSIFFVLNFVNFCPTKINVCIPEHWLLFLVFFFSGGWSSCCCWSLLLELFKVAVALASEQRSVDSLHRMKSDWPKKRRDVPHKPTLCHGFASVCVCVSVCVSVCVCVCVCRCVNDWVGVSAPMEKFTRTTSGKSERPLKANFWRNISNFDIFPFDSAKMKDPVRIFRLGFPTLTPRLPGVGDSSRFFGRWNPPIHQESNEDEILNITRWWMEFLIPFMRPGSPEIPQWFPGPKFLHPEPVIIDLIFYSFILSFFLLLLPRLIDNQRHR